MVAGLMLAVALYSLLQHKVFHSCLEVCYVCLVLYFFLALTYCATIHWSFRCQWGWHYKKCMTWCKETHAVNLSVLLQRVVRYVCPCTVKKDVLQICTTECECPFTAQCCTHAAHCIQKIYQAHCSGCVVICSLSDVYAEFMHS